MPDTTGRVYARLTGGQHLDREGVRRWTGGQHLAPRFPGDPTLQSSNSTPKSTWLPNRSPTHPLCRDTRAFTAHWQPLSCGEWGDTPSYFPSISRPHWQPAGPRPRWVCTPKSAPCGCPEPREPRSSTAPRADTLHSTEISAPPRRSGQAGAVPLQFAGFAVILGQSDPQSPGCPVLSCSHPQRMRTAGSTDIAPSTFLLKGHVRNFPKLPVISELQHFWGCRLLSISPHGK